MYLMRIVVEVVTIIVKIEIYSIHVERTHIFSVNFAPFQNFSILPDFSYNDAAWLKLVNIFQMVDFQNTPNDA